MSKRKPKQTGQKIIPPTATGAQKVAPGLVNSAGFKIPYPSLLLALAVIIVYFPVFSFGLTELDDSIFIKDFHQYNEHLGNLVTSFNRGLFDAVKDPYYRPLFMDSMILNYHLADHGQNILSYHALNVAFHLITVLLLYRLFRKLEIKELYAFILCLVFAVHPVLSQAVAWIPGRNDTILAIFVCSFLLFSIYYSNSGRIRSLLLSGLFLLLAYFTKETAVFAAPVAFVLLAFVLRKNWLEKRNLTQYAMWAGCFLVWFTVRAGATIQTDISLAQMAHDFVPRLPLIVQYLGKVFFPFNLSVFPIQEDTVYYYGIAAIALLGVSIYLYKQRNLRIILSGLGIFILFLLPVLFVPARLNEQSFEHRLYLPVIGILLLLPQTAILNNKLKEKQLFIGSLAVCGLLAIVNYRHQKPFESPLSFWTEAQETSPHSAYATMMLAARLDKDDFERSCYLFRKAYELNPKEKYLNYYYGVMLQKKDSVKESEKYLLAEKNSSGYYECDFYLARAAMERKDFDGAINYLQTFLKKDPANAMAHNNLLLLYINTGQPDKAKAHIQEMQKKGLNVPKEFLQKLGM